MNSDTFVANRIDKAAQRQWMIGKMARLAIHGEREIEARSLFGFQNAGAFKETETNDSFPYAKLAGIVGNPKHHLKVPSPPGPCVLIRPENTSNAHEVFRVANLLIVKPIKCRRTALTYFDNLANAGLLTERSKQTILACRSDLLSSETNRWRQAASRIYDATEQDWLLNLAGLRQALEWNFEVGIWDYLPNVLRPSIIAVDSIDLVWWSYPFCGNNGSSLKIFNPSKSVRNRSSTMMLGAIKRKFLASDESAS